MRKILFLFLKFTGGVQKLWMKIRGKHDADIHNERIISGKAWAEFCDHLKTAGNVLLSNGAPRDPFNQAEGVRYLSRLTRAGLEAFVEYSDPLFPEFRRMVHETIKMGADNPDNFYMNAQIIGKYDYLISGKRNTIDYISFHTQNGNYGTTGGLAPCGKLDNDELILEEDGTFEIYVTKEKRGKNWLRSEDDTSLIMVRQTFANRSVEEPMDLKIANLAGVANPAPVSPATIDEGLKTASLFVGGASLLFTRWAKGFRKHVNQLPLFDPGTSNAAGGDDSIIYYHSYWKLGSEEALLIEVLPPDCDNWNFQLNNYWMESLDYRFFQVSINKHSAVYGSDGTVRVIVAHKDPGIPNWIETAGHQEGTMCWRWYRIHKGANPIEPKCTLLTLNELNT